MDMQLGWKKELHEATKESEVETFMHYRLGRCERPSVRPAIVSTVTLDHRVNEVVGGWGITTTGDTSYSTRARGEDVARPCHPVCFSVNSGGENHGRWLELAAKPSQRGLRWLEPLCWLPTVILDRDRMFGRLGGWMRTTTGDTS